MIRVIQYEPPKPTPAYRALWILGVVAGLFSLVVSAFLIANNLRLKASDPIHAPALQQLVKDLKASPQNEAIREQIRDLDYLARRAFFTSQSFNQAGIWMLAGGLVVMVVAFKTLASYHRTLPFPDGSAPKDDLAANALWARKAVTVAALLLFGFALSLSLPWRSPLDGMKPPATPPGTAPVASSGAKPAVATVLSSVAPKPDAPGSLVDESERRRQWSAFRGGPVDARVPDAVLPTEWDGASGKGIAWRTPLPMPGFGSPVVWGDKVFLSGATADARRVFCVDARTGTVFWSKPVADGASPGEAPRVLGDTGYAAPTMVTDGTRVFALFATGDLAAFAVDGSPAWSVNLGLPDNPYGHGSSLEMHGDLVIVQYDQKKDAFIAGIDAATGKPRWKVARSVGASWSSPLIARLENQPRLVLVADAYLTVHDPASGRELWRVQWGRAGDVAMSPALADGKLLVSCDHVKFAAVDVSTHAVAWENTTEIPGVSTPLALGTAIYGGQSEGGIVCWDARTGKARWQHETEDGFYASPVSAGGRIYLLEKSGRMHIFEANPDAFKSVGQPVLGEEASATPAILGRSLILRGARNLFRIGA